VQSLHGSRMHQFDQDRLTDLGRAIYHIVMQDQWASHVTNGHFIVDHRGFEF